jgi:queuosine precursor transporter
MKSKSHKLFIWLGGFFIANVLLAEFIGVKIFSLEMSLGFTPVALHVFGYDLSFNMTAGVLLWPVVFVMTDIINEYYGKKGVKLLSYMAAGLIAYSFLMIYLSIHLAPADWWPASQQAKGVENMQTSFNAIFGQSNWIIVASLVAFLLGQFIDVAVFHKLRKITGENKIWLRATGSTLVSQLVDSFVVLFIAFKIGAGWPMSKVVAIGVVNYAYKFIVAIALTPILYWAHNMIEKYLGKEEAELLMTEAAAQKD